MNKTLTGEERVSTVRINRKEVMKRNLEMVGITSVLEGFKISVDLFKAKEERNIMKKLKSSVKRTLTKRLAECSNFDDIVQLADEVSFGNMKVKILSEIKEDVKGNNSVDEQAVNFLKILQQITKNTYVGVKEKMPMYISLGIRGDVSSGATCLDKISSSKHDSSYYFKKHKTRELYRVYDLVTALTDVLVTNALATFADTKINDSSFFQTMTENVTTEKDLESFILDSEEFIYRRDKNSLIRFIAEEFLYEYEFANNKTNDEVEIASTYAKAFQMKKNINQSHLKVMRNNSFLQNYKEVEIDNDVDLKEFKKIEEEYVALSHKIFLPKNGGSFRIKKLGKHRAAGIYFPHVDATICDLDHPSSFIHEMGHAIDYTFDKSEGTRILSERDTFKDIRKMYRDILVSRVGRLGDARKSHYVGKRFYYYVKPTEIFARAMEVYYSIKGIETSFLKEKSFYESKIEYVMEDDFISLIVTYFDELLSQRIIRPIKETTHIVNSKVEENIEQDCRKELLSFPLGKVENVADFINFGDATELNEGNSMQLSFFL